MSLNIVKLCVGCDSIEDLEDWIKTIRTRRAETGEQRHFHVTRMMPKRQEELLSGGSIYWVIKGEILCRQTLLDIESFKDSDGIGRCRLVLEPKLILTHSQPRRPFQGWRYLTVEDAPRDIFAEGESEADLPAALRRELGDLGLL